MTHVARSWVGRVFVGTVLGLALASIAGDAGADPQGGERKARYMIRPGGSITAAFVANGGEISAVHVESEGEVYCALIDRDGHYEDEDSGTECNLYAAPQANEVYRIRINNRSQYPRTVKVHAF